MHMRGRPETQVMLRVRPLSGAERTGGAARVLRSAGDGEVYLRAPPRVSSAARDGDEKMYCFDRTFMCGTALDSISASASNESVYQSVGEPAYEAMRRGADAAVIVCGAAGSGKSHVLFGGAAADGIVQRHAARLFRRREHEEDELDSVRGEVAVRCVEVCDEGLNDLLADRSDWSSSTLDLRSTAKGWRLAGGTSVAVGTVAEAVSVASDAMLNRTADECERALGHFILCLTYTRFRRRANAEGAAAEVAEQSASSWFVELAPQPETAASSEAHAITHSLDAMASCVRSVRGGAEPDLLQSPLTQLVGHALLGGYVAVLGSVSPAVSKHAQTDKTLAYLDRMRRPQVRPPQPAASLLPPCATAEWLLGKEHSQALEWMQQARMQAERVLDGLAEVRECRLSDIVVTCFSKAKRAFARQVGEAMFDAVDGDGVGTVSAGTLTRYLRVEFPDLRDKLTELGSKRLQRDWSLLLTMIDTDGDGTIDLDEFAGFFVATGLGSKEHAQEVFWTIDKNRNGSLSGNEFREHFQGNPEFAARLTEAKKDSVQKAWDGLLGAIGDDEDACDRYLTKDEFAELWADTGLSETPDGLGIQFGGDTPEPSSPAAYQFASIAEQLGATRSPPRADDRPRSAVPPIHARGSVQEQRPKSAQTRSGPLPAGIDGIQAAIASRALLTVSTQGRVDYAALLRDQELDLLRRDESLRGYETMIAEVQSYNQKVMRIITEQFNRVLEAKVVQKWQRSSTVPGMTGVKRAVRKLQQVTPVSPPMDDLLDDRVPGDASVPRVGPDPLSFRSRPKSSPRPSLAGSPGKSSSPPAAAPRGRLPPLSEELSKEAKVLLTSAARHT
eukprot:TRINITY_DN685_c1_g1_i3.p1 TRINITY_DN685_c1_g1~~TRINITY_DN685_c1_g1_i3.p1  ORF type:complete len:843 (+),score=274.12 TRINITY_DN685_c1_g1_i3:63-2591(+)